MQARPRGDFEAVSRQSDGACDHRNLRARVLDCMCEPFYRGAGVASLHQRRPAATRICGQGARLDARAPQKRREEQASRRKQSADEDAMEVSKLKAVAESKVASDESKTVSKSKSAHGDSKADLESKVVHDEIATPAEPKAGRDETKSTPVPKVHDSETGPSHWSQHRSKLNEIAYAPKPRSQEKALKCTEVSWSQIRPLYVDEVVQNEAAFLVTKLPDAKLDVLVSTLEVSLQAYGPAAIDGSGRQRSECILTIVKHVVALMAKDSRLRFEEPLTSDAIKITRQSDMFIKCGKRKVVIVGAKRQDPVQGQAQALLLADLAMATNEAKGDNSEHVLAIVTTFTVWVFFRRAFGRVEQASDAINEQRHLRKDMAKVSGRLLSMLQ